MHIGVDLSLSSPGVAVCSFETYESVKDTYRSFNSRFYTKKRKRSEYIEPVTEIDKNCIAWSFMSFSQRQTDLIASSVDDRIVVYPKQKTYPQKNLDIDRYIYVTDAIINFINTERTKQNIDVKNCFVFIEGYAFKTSGAGSSFKLHEIGGILRYALSKNGILSESIRTLYPTQWKSCNVGVKASKFDTLCHMKPILNIEKAFQTSTKCTEKKVPNPHQDIADAIGITLASFYLK
jgi:hypothetical protein